jgi:hypothetical protein
MGADLNFDDERLEVGEMASGRENSGGRLAIGSTGPPGRILSIGDSGG